MQVVPKRKHRYKKSNPDMMPVKKWLSLNEACAFMDLSHNVFQDMVSKYGLTVSTLPPLGNSQRSNKKYYLWKELEGLIDQNILIKQIS